MFVIAHKFQLIWPCFQFHHIIGRQLWQIAVLKRPNVTSNRRYVALYFLLIFLTILEELFRKLVTHSYLFGGQAVWHAFRILLTRSLDFRPIKLQWSTYVLWWIPNRPLSDYLYISRNTYCFSSVDITVWALAKIWSIWGLIKRS